MVCWVQVIRWSPVLGCNRHLYWARRWSYLVYIDRCALHPFSFLSSPSQLDSWVHNCQVVSLTSNYITTWQTQGLWSVQRYWKMEAQTRQSGDSEKLVNNIYSAVKSWWCLTYLNDRGQCNWLTKCETGCYPGRRLWLQQGIRHCQSWKLWCSFWALDYICLNSVSTEWRSPTSILLIHFLIQEWCGSHSWLCCHCCHPFQSEPEHQLPIPIFWDECQLHIVKGDSKYHHSAPKKWSKGSSTCQSNGGHDEAVNQVIINYSE